MPKTSSATKTRSIRTTAITVDWEDIDWDRLNTKCCIVRYDLPPRSGDLKTYFQRIHNWYKDRCDEPCYFYSYGPHLYVLYDSAAQIKELKYDSLPLNWAVIKQWDLKGDFHCLVKVLISNYFRVSGQFVSNADFILRAQNDDDEFILGLKVNVKQDGHQLQNFLITDEAFRLRKMLPTEMENIQDWSRRLCYGRLYKGQSAIFKQLKLSQINNRQKKEGIYVEYHNPNNRASLTYHSLRSMKDLEESRSYLLSNFISKLLPYLNSIGLPFQQKYLEMESVETIRGDEIKKSQVPEYRHPIYIVDGRIKPEYYPDNFMDEFSTLANSLLFGSSIVFQRREVSNLCDGDWILRLQDYDVDDFSLEDGILKDHQDSKPDFYRMYGNVVKQTININPNTDKQREDIRRKKGKVWSKEEYLDYSVTDLDQEKYKLLLEVCVNQLLLKDVVMNPFNVPLRLPQVKYMEGKVFIFNGILLYLEKDDLMFFRIPNNDLENATNILQRKTGKDLVEDVFVPAAQFNYKRPDDPKVMSYLLGRKFIVTSDYVMEINDSEIRVLYEDMEIKRRFEGNEEIYPKAVYYPQSPIHGNEYFTEDQLKLFSDFLDNNIKEFTLSFNQLKFQYGKHIRDERGKIIEKDGGFYRLLGIVNDRKLKQFYEKYGEITFESVREQHLLPVYQGIWYSPLTRHYLVGSPYGRNIGQERGFVLREVICHQGELKGYDLYQKLLNDLFPMLELNLVRFRNYTVYPFPFKFAEIWSDIDSLKQ